MFVFKEIIRKPLNVLRFSHDNFRLAVLISFVLIKKSVLNKDHSCAVHASLETGCTVSIVIKSLKLHTIKKCAL